MDTARCKALDVHQHHLEADVIIAADTVVVANEQILEKPANEEDAFQMLSALSGQVHHVYTGVAILYKHQAENGEGKIDSIKVDVWNEKTEVEFDQLSADVIRAYIATREPLDKAGSYGIQGIGGCLIRRINGDYFNVVGFPVNSFSNHIVENSQFFN
eukprot:TRINITY_DN12475_c0_g1_i4.p1 TRINITY_DN12475_c0_g1~~TRINITY_DN12475_c0_g1_i4.p1  ORF type:complete len:158 (-),score=27.01 TRINITY_DN12475_c0_g1_i4:33-506(-)